MRPCASGCTCEGLRAYLHLCVCIVVPESGRQLGLLKRECVRGEAMQGQGITKGGENGECSCEPLGPKPPAERMMMEKKERKEIGLC